MATPETGIAECPPPVISTLNRRKYKKDRKLDI